MESYLIVYYVALILVVLICSMIFLQVKLRERRSDQQTLAGLNLLFAIRDYLENEMNSDVLMKKFDDLLDKNAIVDFMDEEYGTPIMDQILCIDDEFLKESLINKIIKKID